MVIAGFQCSSSFKIDRQTVPEGYTLGWNNGGTNLPMNVSYAQAGGDVSRGPYTLVASWGILRAMSAFVQCSATEDWRTIRKDQCDFEQTPLPQRLLLARYTTLPRFEIEAALRVASGFGVESERMVSSPLLALLL